MGNHLVSISEVVLTPNRLAQLHWLCCFAILCQVLLLLIFELSRLLWQQFATKSTSTEPPPSRSQHSIYTLYIRNYYARGVFFFGLLYYCLCLASCLRLYMTFAAAQKASLLDIFVPRKGASLFDILGHCVFYYASMMVANVRAPLLLLVICDCLKHMFAAYWILPILHLGVTGYVLHYLSGRKSHLKIYGRWSPLLLFAFALPGVAFLDTQLRLLIFR